MRRPILLLCCIIVLVGVVPLVNAQTTQPTVRRCINLGNTLEAPVEGEWGFIITEEDITTIADAGFDSIRIPIRWSVHAAETEPYTIDAEFFERIDEVIGWALETDLQVIVNIHHYEEIMQQPADHIDRLKSLWQQITEHYLDSPSSVVFEVLNEPNTNLTMRLWNTYQLELLALIHEIDPDRMVMIGGADWNSAGRMTAIELPENADYLIATFHNYDPFRFTHQGAEWVDDSDYWLGTTWGNHESNYEDMRRILDGVTAWRDEHNIPVILGEFGAYSRADMDSRLRWTTSMVQEAEARDIGWCYWEFAAGFGIYNRQTKQFNDLYTALIPDE